MSHCYMASLTELVEFLKRSETLMEKNNSGYNSDLCATIPGAGSREDIRAVPEEKI